ncbi:hypothetical protein GQ44DRAFT_714411 [Phaeosphaeriaceae sp. PMI808]|nr:hypothetical protein GQ44DRAFT_714411 [Phaeosphaeriaceae sp. PMI808]
MFGVLASPPPKCPRADPHNNTPFITTPHTSSHILPDTPPHSDNWSRTKSQPPRPQVAFTTS